LNSSDANRLNHLFVQKKEYVLDKQYDLVVIGASTAAMGSPTRQLLLSGAAAMAHALANARQRHCGKELMAFKREKRSKRPLNLSTM
jgi:hypothetical protein